MSLEVQINYWSVRYSKIQYLKRCSYEIYIQNVIFSGSQIIALETLLKRFMALGTSWPQYLRVQ